MLKIGGMFASRGTRCFSSTPVVLKKKKKIDLTPFTTPKGRMLPTSKWHLSHVEPFCDVAFRGGLGFTKKNLKDVKLFPDEEVFADCPARTDDIVNGTWELDLKDVPRQGIGRVEQNVNACFAQLEAALYQLKEKEPDTGKAEPTEGNLDSLAVTLASLCGFNDGKNFRIRRERIRFTLGGNVVNSRGDVFVASRHRARGQLVLIWEDKLSRRQKTQIGGDASLLQDSAAQIIGEMLSVHYRNNLRGYKAADVYAVRLIDDMVTFFKMKMSAKQIEAVCKEGVIPNSKLKVEYTPKPALEAGDTYGMSLLSPMNRDLFVRTMACIRAEILKRELPDSPKWKSKKDGLDVILSDF